MIGCYVVRCRVSGGVTGTRESMLHEGDRLLTFAVREDAQREADRLNTRAKETMRHTLTCWAYWVEPYTGRD